LKGINEYYQCHKYYQYVNNEMGERELIRNSSSLPDFEARGDFRLLRAALRLAMTG
jgi:hypothetical protein